MIEKDDTRESENQQENVVTHVPDQWINSVFSDLVIVNNNNEYVTLTFLQKLPFELKQTLENENHKQTSVVARVTFSWPHFFRFAELIERTAENNKEGVVKYLGEIAYNKNKDSDQAS